MVAPVNYSRMEKVTGTSDKFYNIWISEIGKNEYFIANTGIRAPAKGYEVYSIYGRNAADAQHKTHHVGMFFSQTAASRAAKRLQESKLQKGYSVKTSSPSEVDPAASLAHSASIIPKKSEKLEPLFKALSPKDLKMTKSQKDRFAHLIE